MTISALVRSRPASAGRSSRVKPFTLTVRLGVPRLALSLRTPGRDGTPTTERLVTLEGGRAQLTLPTVLDLLHRAGFSLPKLEAKGGGWMRLPEPLGARLALLLWAVAPVQKPSRAALIRSGIAALVDEEVYYWYAKAEGSQGEGARQRRSNALKALRILLAGE